MLPEVSFPGDKFRRQAVLFNNCRLFFVCFIVYYQVDIFEIFYLFIFNFWGGIYFKPVDVIRIVQSPGWCGLVDWAQAWEPKGRWFDSQSGHRPGLQTRSPVEGVREATTH